MIHSIRNFLLVLLAIFLLGACCSVKQKQQDLPAQANQSPDSLSTPVDSATYQRGIQYSIEEKLLKVHKEKLKTKSQ